MKERNITLKEALQGTQRVPSLLISKPTEQVAALSQYEIFTSEGLHDMKDHIKNIFEELPRRLDCARKSALERLKDLELSTRCLARGCDYRRAAVKLPLLLKGKVSQDTQDLIDTLAELTIHLHATEDQRSP